MAGESLMCCHRHMTSNGLHYNKPPTRANSNGAMQTKRTQRTNLAACNIQHNSVRMHNKPHHVNKLYATPAARSIEDL